MKILFFLIFIVISSCSVPTVNRPKSDHFDGKRFYNPKYPQMKKTIVDLLKWKINGDKKQWPEFVDITPQKVPQARNKVGELSTTFINHASFLIQIDGVNVLTDPIWSERTSPVSFAGPKRVKVAGVNFEDLPKIDVIIISHNHYDHFDIPTLERLIERDNPKIIWGLGNTHYLRDKYHKNAIELDWNEKTHFSGIEFHFLPSKHWSKRGLFDENCALWGAFAIKGSRLVYFGGDTGYSDHFKTANKIFGAFDLSLLPIGAYEPRWFMKDAHMNPQDAVKAHHDLKSKLSIGMHFGTFQLTDESIDAPVKDLFKSRLEADNFIVLKEGQSLSF